MTGNEGFLDVGGAEKSFAGHRVLNGVDIKIARGEFVSLLGPSGCGKTTLLRIVSGLMSPDQGVVKLDGKDITNTPPHLRDVGVVFQNYALFPHLSVAENVRFGLRARKSPHDQHKPPIIKFLGLLHIKPFPARPVMRFSVGVHTPVPDRRRLARSPTPFRSSRRVSP
ncbi:MAG: ATP-binding cassette domain-containing protein, partial [Alphaproteobacteria bacterium]|nr:ATP-binding cassette domain-containing protein [Alphaproteobacteria bacterium]